MLQYIYTKVFRRYSIDYIYTHNRIDHINCFLYKCIMCILYCKCWVYYKYIYYPGSSIPKVDELGIVKLAIKTQNKNNIRKVMKMENRIFSTFSLPFTLSVWCRIFSSIEMSEKTHTVSYGLLYLYRISDTTLYYILYQTNKRNNISKMYYSLRNSSIS